MIALSFDEVVRAVRQAKQTIRLADMHVSDIAYLCVDRLRSSGVSRSTLRRLKDELRNFNVHTGVWKDK